MINYGKIKHYKLYTQCYIIPIYNFQTTHRVPVVFGYTKKKDANFITICTPMTKKSEHHF